MGRRPIKLYSKMHQARLDRGMTTGELAALVGVTPKYIAQWETWRKKMPTARVEQVAGLLGVHADELLKGTVIPPGISLKVFRTGERLPPLCMVCGTIYRQGRCGCWDLVGT